MGGKSWTATLMFLCLEKTLIKGKKIKPEKIYLLGPHSATGDLVVIVATAKVMSAGLQKGAHRLLHIKQQVHIA